MLWSGEARHYLLNQEAGYGVLQAVVESLVNRCLGERPSEPIVITHSIEEPLRILGFYSPGVHGSGVYRRFTGGREYLGDDLLYIGILLPGGQGLRQVYSHVAEMLMDLGLRLRDGWIEGGGVYGATRFGDVGLAEILVPRGMDIGGQVLGLFTRVSRHVYSVRGLEKYRGLQYTSRSWVGYSAGEGDIEEVIGDMEGFWMRLVLYMHEIYIREARIEGSFYAAPPAAPYNIMAFLRGAHVDELIFYQAELSWRKMEFLGLDVEEVVDLLRRAYTSAEKYISRVEEG